MTVIATHGLGKRYGKRLGLDGVDLRIQEGEIFGFLGPNGAGKTTAIRLLLGFMRPSFGSANIFGLDCWRESRRIKAEIGYVAGDLRLYSWMHVRAALKTVGKIRGRDLMTSGLELAERFNLDLTVRVRKMSRGMRQKLGLILALAHSPRLLILDEPTSGLDPLMHDELVRYLRERAASGQTVFFSSHALSEVDQLCDRVAIVRDGRIVADATLETLKQRATRVVTLQFAEAPSRELTPPPRLVIEGRSERSWFGQWEGPAGELAAWAGSNGVEDMTIGPPNLESAFLAYYRKGEP